MNLVDVVQGGVWGIIPEKLDAIHQVLWRHVNNQKIDLELLQSQIGKKLENTYDARITDDGVAILTIDGIIAKRMNFFMEISGGVSTEFLVRDFKAAVKNRDVKAILLDIDSPGGTVDGTQALVDLIYESRGEKPIVAFANGLAASAAYWIASAADRIFVEETGEVGSIGVVMKHYDYSRYDEKMGVKVTHIYAGKYKTMGNDSEPISREGRDYLQSLVDYNYSIFVDSVARNRGVSSDAVLQDMAEGRIFIGRQGVEAGLADRIGNFEAAYLSAVEAADRDRKESIYPAAQGNLKSQTKEETMDITLQTLEKDVPDLLDQIRAEARQGGYEEGLQEGRTQGRTEERNRVTDILAADGDFATAKTAIEDGTGAEAAYRMFFEAERKKRVDGLAELDQAAPPSLGQQATDDPPEEKDPEKALMIAAKKRAVENKISVAQAMREIQAEDQDAVARALPQLQVVK